MSNVYIVATFNYEEQHKEKALRLMEELVSKTVEEEGCIRFELIEDKERNYFYFLNEVWENKSLHEKHMKSEHFQTITTEIKTILKEQIVFEGSKVF